MSMLSTALRRIRRAPEVAASAREEVDAVRHQELGIEPVEEEALLPPAFEGDELPPADGG